MRSKEELDKYITDEQTIQRLRYVYFKKLKRSDDFEDFYQDYAVNILEGKGAHQTIDYFAIDWLREKTFYNRKLKIAPKFFELNPSFDFRKAENSHLSEAYRELVIDLANKHVGRTRIIVFLHYLFGLNLSEIGDVLNVTESRVSQLLTKIREGKPVGDYIPDEEDIGLREQTEVEKLRFENKILSNKLAKAFREKYATR